LYFLDGSNNYTKRDPKGTQKRPQNRAQNGVPKPYKSYKFIIFKPKSEWGDIGISENIDYLISFKDICHIEEIMKKTCFFNSTLSTLENVVFP